MKPRRRRHAELRRVAESRAVAKGSAAKHGAGRSRGWAIPGLPSVLSRSATDLIDVVRGVPRGYAELGKAVAADLMQKDALRYARAVNSGKRKKDREPWEFI